MNPAPLGSTFTTAALVSKTKYDYVKDFEREESCLPNCWIVVRIDGRNFFQFTETHKFAKPNDIQALELMNCAATSIMEELHRDVVIAFGQSDEFSFVFRKDTQLYDRKPSKLLSAILSFFTSAYVYNWPRFFKTTPLFYPPAFDARVILYPTDKNLRDYLAWRQADIHINNLYSTCFWNLVIKKKMPPPQAEEMLKGTLTAHKIDLLNQEFGINYNNEPNMFRQGTTLIRKLVVNNLGILKPTIVPYSDDIINDRFWKENPEILGLKSLATYQGPQSNLLRCHRPNVNSELQPNLPNYSGNSRPLHNGNQQPNPPGHLMPRTNSNLIHNNSKFGGNNISNQMQTPRPDNSRTMEGPMRLFGLDSDHQNKNKPGLHSNQGSQGYSSNSSNLKKNFKSGPYVRKDGGNQRSVDLVQESNSNNDQ